MVCGSGPLLFLNQGNGKFSLKPDAFKFAQPPQGTFTHAAIADYDRDGRLDIYFCLYSYYLGLDQYHYPVPVLRRAQWAAEFPAAQRGQRDLQRSHRSCGTERRQRPLQFCLRLGRSTTPMARPIFTWPTTSAAAISIATTATEHSRPSPRSGRGGRRRGHERLLVRFRQRRQSGYLRRQHVVRRRHAGLRSKDFS